jgi:uncharacterized protein (UPF0147 family)
MSSGTEEQVLEIIRVMEELREDSTVPRNVKTKLETSIGVLKNKGNELRLRIDKVLQELDEVANDTNAQSYTRSQIWNIVSMLESIEN